MASELARRIVDAIAGAKLNDPDGVTDELLAPVLEFISLVNSKPCECESMKQHALEILDSLDPKPEQGTGKECLDVIGTYEPVVDELPEVTLRRLHAGPKQEDADDR